MKILMIILSNLSYVFVYADKLFLKDNPYANNLSMILLITYWVAFILMLLIIILWDQLLDRKPLEERVTFMDRVLKRSFFQDFRRIAFWLFVLGMGVIGTWKFFIPLILLGLLDEALKVQIFEYAKRLPKTDPAPVKSSSKKVTSRYKLIKEN